MQTLQQNQAINEMNVTNQHHELLVTNLQKTYQQRQVVKDVSLSICSGQIIGLLGPNGAGKTTSFYMIVGLVSPDKGSVSIDGQNMTYLPMHKRASLGLSYLPQEMSIFRGMTVAQNVLAILELQKNLNKQQRKQRLDELLSELNITHLANSSAMALSGGERRRAEIARTLATNPKFILLDEPFAGVDPIAIGDIQSIILFLKQKNVGVLITDHNVRETLGICDYAYIISQGVVLTSGTAEQIIDNEQVKAVYLGKNFNL